MGDVTLKDIFEKLWNFGLPIVMFAVWSYSGFKGWWVWRRELDTATGTCSEWKTIALRSLGYAESTGVIAQKVLESVK